MLSPTQENLLFESLVIHQPQLKTYLQGELDKQVKALVSLNDGEQLRRAQGHAQALQSLIGRLDKAKEALQPKKG